MKGKFVLLLLFALPALSLPAYAADPCGSSHSPDLAKVLDFQLPPADGVPGGWRAKPPKAVSMDEQIVHDAKSSVRVESAAGSPTPQLSVATACVQTDFSGKTVELHGLLRTEDVTGTVGLWLREDADGQMLALDNMHDKNVHGTTEWTEYSVTLPSKPGAQRLIFGFYLAGSGKLWVSDLRLLVDGIPIWEAPKAVPPPPTVLDTDQEFSNGSGIAIQALTPAQIDNLVTLGKIWGFLKYYDPTVTSGQRQWDFDLFRILPTILAAPDRPTADAALLRWITALGPVPKCASCGIPDQGELQLRPDLAWIADEQHLGKALSESLRWIRDNGPDGKQFYVTLAPGVGNPGFEHELPYASIRFPDDGFQLLALYRYWNIIEYWYPYRNIVGEDWDQVLADSIPKIALAGDHDSYGRQLMTLIARVHDTHANLWSSVQARPPVGSCDLPVRLRFVQDQPVVTGYPSDGPGAASGMKIGDVITEIDGVPVAELIKRWSPYYGASNEAALMRDIATYMPRGNCGKSTIGIHRDDQDLHLQVERVALQPSDHGYTFHDLAGPTFRLLSPEVGYLKLSAIKASEVAGYVEQASGTKGLIIDLRNYPSDFVVFALGSLLVDRETPFVRFATSNLMQPGAFYWTPPLSLDPGKPHYTGKVVILVDEVTQSSAEYTGMALRAAPGAIVIGSTTAGADGNVSTLVFPGGMHTLISGIGVFYPNKKPTQHVGIVPDVVVTPTIAGVQAGRDEVLEKAIQLIVGAEIPESQLMQMYNRTN